MLRVTPIEPGRPDTDEPRPSPLRVGTANASCEVPQRMLSKPVIPSQPSRCRDLKRQGPPMRRGSAEERARNIRGELVLRVGREQRRDVDRRRSEEHTSELQSRGHLVCRLLLEKKKEQDTQ